jgi:hypothetical protein
MTELAQGHWTSGAGRFLAAITTLLLLIVGVVVGQQAVASSDRLVLTSFGTVPTWVRVFAPLLAGVAMTHLFPCTVADGVRRARLRAGGSTSNRAVGSSPVKVFSPTSTRVFVPGLIIANCLRRQAHVALLGRSRVRRTS